jgi:hypothetical protein
MIFGAFSRTRKPGCPSRLTIRSVAARTGGCAAPFQATLAGRSIRPAAPFAARREPLSLAAGLIPSNASKATALLRLVTGPARIGAGQALYLSPKPMATDAAARFRHSVTMCCRTRVFFRSLCQPLSLNRAKGLLMCVHIARKPG